jgi:uncharacterized protein (TIGR02145 family)
MPKIHRLPIFVARDVFIAMVLLTFVAAASFAQAPAKPDTASAKRKLLVVAVMPLSAQGEEESSAKILTEALADEILRLRKTRVMERSQMETILKEQGFQQSGACDKTDCAVEVGRILGIDRMVVGSIGKLGTTHTLSLRALDVATGEVVASTRKSFKGEIDLALTEMIPISARELVSAMSGQKMVELESPETPMAEVKVFTDPRDDQKYEYVRIGSLDWMTRNMNYHVSDYHAWCYDAAPANCGFLGRLYTWDKANLACPPEWHLPSARNWDEFIAILGGSEKAGAYLRAPKGSRDNSLFKARPAGFRDQDGNFMGNGSFAIWWTSTDSDSAQAYARSLDFGTGSTTIDAAPKAEGHSVRCVR